jgi:hypothetical protein
MNERLLSIFAFMEGSLNDNENPEFRLARRLVRCRSAAGWL